MQKPPPVFRNKRRAEAVYFFVRYVLLFQHYLQHSVPVIYEGFCYLVAVCILISARMYLSFAECKYLCVRKSEEYGGMGDYKEL